MIQSMQSLNETQAIPYSRQCREGGMPYASVMRWRTRIREGREPVTVPGPRKTEPLDLKGLQDRIHRLSHGRQRTAQTLELHREFSNQISRRRLQRLITEARTEENRRKRDEQYRINWLVPGSVWAVDDTEYRDMNLEQKVFLHSTRDLASTYIFDPLADTHLAHGPEIAENLRELFDQYGAPLFLKRDNGKNLNHHAVNELLSEYMVLPVNSPPYYPQYNGSVEQSQSEIKSELMGIDYTSLRELRLAARVGAHNLNHRRRRCLCGITPCVALLGSDNGKKQYRKRQRKEVYDRIVAMAAIIKTAAQDACTVDTAWRLAVETWLLDNGFITMSKTRKCYPIYSSDFIHH